MTPQERKVFELARTALNVQLDALLGKAGHLHNHHRREYAEIGIKAIDEALAQPEQEPVGEVVDALHDAFKCNFTKVLPVGTKLYTTPPQRKPLTDEQIQKCYETTGHYQTLRPQDKFAVFALARAIEAAHGIKE